ncbi:MAG: DUF1294 domain-containing protein [Lachnospiraceae bacterium]|nr:DUF1294 domain-containing protein [Lachnospiraceae bacterium]
MTTVHWLICYFAAVNLIGFAAMGIDKHKAKNHAWRIPEATLFFVAFIGGVIGSIAGMRVFHHKTKHKAFVWGMPLILLLWIGLVLFILLNPDINITLL